MPDVPAAIRNAYGSHPAHLLSLLGCFALTGYVVSHLAGNPSLPRILVWFGGAVIAHDLIAFPLYTLAERILARTLTSRTTQWRVPLLNYVRVPACGSALLFLIFLPGIVRQGGVTYRAATGQTQQPYLIRWLLLAAVLFGCSAVAYLARVVLARRSSSADDPH